MRRTRTRAALLVASLAMGVAGVALAESGRQAVVITPGSNQTFRVALQHFSHAAQAGPRPAKVNAFRETMSGALEYSGVFEMISEDAFLGPATTPAGDDPVCVDWSQIGAAALIDGNIEFGESSFEVAYRVWDTATCRVRLARRYTQPLSADQGRLARRIADDIVESFIGLRGVSATELAFVSDRGGNKEIYVMSADGTRARPATANRSINNFPGWSPDGDSILYTSYRLRDRPMLFLSSRGRGRPGLVLNGAAQQRSQYRGVFAPDGERVAVVLADDGNSQIYTVRADGSRLRQVTKGRAIHVSPTWSPDGERLAYVSDRTGSPQIYVSNGDGTNARRLTYNGDYNTNPSWSPDGLWIAYESRVNYQFDIWLIDPDGDANVPIVMHRSSDESPSWSPNGRKIVFSSTRRGRADLYVVDRDGTNLRRLTRDSGNNTSPAWGPFPQ
jgi:TolB protein